MRTDVLAFVGPMHADSAGHVSQAYSEHAKALRGYLRPIGAAVSDMLRGWQLYATKHAQRYESPIGDDGIIGEEWADIGEALLGLLNGELGGWDAGSLDSNIRQVMHENGITDRECVK